MDSLFLTILNMSLTGAFIIAVICLVRFPLKKAPKFISYCLWAVAGFRLAFPFTIESPWSLIPFRTTPIRANNVVQPTLGAGGTVENNLPAMDIAVSGTFQGASNNYLATTVTPTVGVAETGSFFADVNLLTVATAIWLVGAVLMLTYAVVSYLFLTHKMRKATLLHTNIYEADTVQTPFVLGIFTPKIYLPPNLDEDARYYVILHEQVHIQRRDHIVKIIAYLILCIHWFNPLAWLAFALMNTDMEMSCDETVLKKLGTRIKKDYSRTLVTLATDWRMSAPTPLAFSEGRIKGRIKHIMKFKKSHKLITLMAVILVVALSLGFAVSQAEDAVYDGPDELEYDGAISVDNDVAGYDFEEINTVDNDLEHDETYVEDYCSETGHGIITTAHGEFEGAEFDVYSFECPINGYPVGADTLSPQEAGQIGAEFIWTMFGKSIDGMRVSFEHSAPEWSARTYWHGRVFDDQSSWLFEFNIDAITGEWLDIGNLVVYESLVYSVDIDLTREEGQYLHENMFTVFSITLTPEEIQFYSEVAREFAERHFRDNRAVNISIFETAMWFTLGRDADGNLIAESHVISVGIADDTGRVFMGMSLCSQTLQLLRTFYYSETPPGWYYDGPYGYG
ncbi:MAG: M56 family metallopeptidase [Oscillospiraceae bacterium]|nr:M56 family metallopeptidase [Oscillospiraceae bacterium]